MPKSALTGGQKKIFRAGKTTGRKSLKEIQQLLKPGENLKQYGKAYELSKQMMAPQVQEARREFSQETAPELIANLGVGSGAKTSSALNQALSSSLANLQARLEGQQNALAAQLAESDVNRRFQAAQYGGQVGQNMLNVSPYLQKSGEPGFGKQLLGQGLNLLGGAIGTAVGGPVGGIIGSTAAGAFTRSKGWAGSSGGPTTSIGGIDTSGNISPQNTSADPFAANKWLQGQ